MPRIPFLDEANAAVPAGLVAAIKTRRGGSLGDLDRLLIHSEAVADGWNALFGALASRCSIDIRTRELALIRIGILNRGGYELYQHKRIALKAGVSRADINALVDWHEWASFSSCDRAVLAYTDAMTLDIQVPDAVFDALKRFFNARQIVELTANIAGYNMVTRFMEALELKPPE